MSAVPSEHRSLASLRWQSSRGDLLLVVEPATGPAAPGADALAAEAVRLAGALEAGLASVTWPAESPAALEQVADALAELVQATQPAAVLLLDTDAGRQLAPMVAQRCGSGAVTGCSDVVVREQPLVAGGDPPRRTLAFVKPVFGGWLQREVDAVAGGPPVATLDLTDAEPATALAADAFPQPQVLEIDTAAVSRVRHLELIPPDARSVDLVHARRIVAAGSGVASDELLDAVRELADLLEGSVGATRPMTDDGRLPKERLIGQTGRSVSPELYLALGISGSPHHVAGVRGADRVLSINRDVRAPIFQFSDVGYVADLETVLPALVRRISEWRDEPGSAR